MCQSKEQGGKRCNCDTSGKRRLRRKAESLIRNNSYNRFLPNLPSYDNMDDIKTASADLRERMDAGPEEWENEDEFYERMEQEASLLGSSILKIAGKEPLDKKTRASIRLHNKELKKLNSEGSKLGEKRWELIQEKQNIIDEFHNNREEEDRPVADAVFAANVIPNGVYAEDLSPDNTDEEDGAARIQQKLDNPNLSKNQRKFYEKLKKAQSRSYEIIREMKETEDKLQATNQSLTERMIERNRLENSAIAKKTRELLAQTRDMGGSMNVAKESNEKLVQIINEDTSAHYPSAWIAQHNAMGGESMVVSNETQMRVDTDSYDGFYDHNKIFYDKEDGVLKDSVPNGGFVSVNDPTCIEGSKAVFETANLPYTTEQTSEGWLQTPTEVFRFSTPIVQTTEPEDKKNWEPTPNLNAGFFYMSQHPHIDFKSDEGRALLKKHMDANPVWTLKSQHTLVSQPYLFVDDKLESNNRKSVLLHEMGHRMEHILPNKRLPKMETAFLKRRSKGKPAEVQGDKLIYSTDITTREYASREYPNLDNKEVFTTGMESVFYGVHNSKDDDHRAFVVGSLATL